MQYQVTIQDSNNLTCRISLTIPFVSSTTNPGNASFQVVDRGLIVPNIGGCNCNKPFGITATDIQLLGADGQTWGLTIAAMFDAMGLINASGTGTLVQAWCVGLQPGNITWINSSGSTTTSTSSSTTASTDTSSDSASA